VEADLVSADVEVVILPEVERVCVHVLNPAVHILEQATEASEKARQR
jgi:hypothetical protein